MGIGGRVQNTNTIALGAATLFISMDKYLNCNGGCHSIATTRLACIIRLTLA